MAADLTEEEYDALDEEMTRKDIHINLNGKPGIFTRQDILFEALDEVSAKYVKAKSDELEKWPTSIIRDMIREKIANVVGAVAEVSYEMR
ncbi:MAG: hypothetical protein LBQ94_00110 [Treponema sp.]|jgi:hypothetical protein|nr:hypothetical protein [Treponema sp.]